MAGMIQCFGGKRVLFVMAVDLEYGPALRARIDPLMTGVGPVEAAVMLTAALAEDRPDLIVSLGSAGSVRLAQGTIAQVSAVAWRDIDASALGIPRGQVPFLDLGPRVDLPLRLPGLTEATLSTGANVVSGRGYGDIAEDMVDMVDMETYAHLRAATRFGVPLIGLRGVSDGAIELGRMGDWSDALPMVDAGLAGAVDVLEAALQDGLLD